MAASKTMPWKQFRGLVEDHIEPLEDLLDDVRTRLEHHCYLQSLKVKMPNGTSSHFVKQSVDLLSTAEMATEESLSYFKGILDWDEEGNYKPK